MADAIKIIKRKSSRGNSSGFTVIELMVVVAIISIIMIIAIPNFARMQQRARIRSGAQEVGQDLRQIRERAISGSGTFQINFPDTRHYVVTNPDGNSTSYRLGGSGGILYFGGVGVAGHPPEGSLPAPGINGIDFPGSILTIDARGGATSGVIYMTNGRDNYAVGINSLGKVKVYQFENGVWY